MLVDQSGDQLQLGVEPPAIPGKTEVHAGGGVADEATEPVADTAVDGDAGGKTQQHKAVEPCAGMSGGEFASELKNGVLDVIHDVVYKEHNRKKPALAG